MSAIFFSKSFLFDFFLCAILRYPVRPQRPFTLTTTRFFFYLLSIVQDYRICKTGRTSRKILKRSNIITVDTFVRIRYSLFVNVGVPYHSTQWGGTVSFGNEGFASLPCGVYHSFALLGVDRTINSYFYDLLCSHVVCDEYRIVRGSTQQTKKTFTFFSRIFAHFFLFWL